jgi:hypothetical protein
MMSKTAMSTVVLVVCASFLVLMAENGAAYQGSGHDQRDTEHRLCIEV